MAGVQFVMDPEAIQRFCRGSNVTHDLMRRGQKIEDAAKRDLRMGHVRGGGADSKRAGSKVSHVNLRDTIHKRIVQGSGGLPMVVLEATAPHAIFVHDGTRPHIIRPRSADGVLAWYSGGGGGDGESGMAFATYVNHPGTQPNPFFTRNLHLAVE
jgi:hypothetical protein